MQLMLTSTLGQLTLEPNKDGKWQLPVGTYRPRMITLVEKDDKGVETRLNWNYKGGKLSQFEIVEGKTTIIPAGTPLSIGTEIGSSRDNLSIGLSITGRAGEGYSARVIKTGTTRPAPTLKIKDRHGEVLAEGNFAYG